MLQKDYGLWIYPAGLIIHGDGRKRVRQGKDIWLAPPRGGAGRQRATVKAFSAQSLKRLEFISANAAGRFRTMITLTYHAPGARWESSEERNLRVAQGSKRDLNRFLSCMRDELGPYLWVQEFQKRGVIHYHVLCVGTPAQERIAVAWTRSTGELHDAAALRHAVRVESVRDQEQVRSYLGRYLGKERQKDLPPGVVGAGRWWGRSRGLALVPLRELITHCAGEFYAQSIESRTLRSFRTWLTRRLGFKVRRGMFRDWGNRYAFDAVGVVDRLEAFYTAQAERTAT